MTYEGKELRAGEELITFVSTTQSHTFVMNTVFFLVLACIMLSSVRAFTSRPFAKALGAVRQSRALSMITITDGVEFDTIAREWRMKWTPDDDKKSLAAAQQSLTLFTSAIKKIDGVQSVQRVVCGGCLDFKVVIALTAEKYGAWVRTRSNAFHRTHFI